MGVRVGIAATTGTAGYGMSVVPRHGDKEAGGRPTQHGVGVLLLQIRRCRPSKQY